MRPDHDPAALMGAADPGAEGDTAETREETA